MSFDTVHNRYEKDVYAKVIVAGNRYPAILQNSDLLADAACIALNNLRPRYIRHEVDLSFHITDVERVQEDHEISLAVESALQYIQSRDALKAD